MTTTVGVVIPVLNEERALPNTVDVLLRLLSEQSADISWRVVIVDNGSTDSTPELGRQLAGEHAEVEYLRLEERGRGRALKTAWTGSTADVVTYMDVDLSTDPSALPDLVRAITEDGYDVSIGSRLRPGAKVIGRSLRREVISRSYNLLVWLMFFVGFRDAQCGFKAVSRRVADSVVPLARDNGWFFDTEMLLVAEKTGHRIKEVPVRWTDDPDSRVRVMNTAWGDFKGLVRMRFGGLRSATRALRSRG